MSLVVLGLAGLGAAAAALLAGRKKKKKGDAGPGAAAEDRPWGPQASGMGQAAGGGWLQFPPMAVDAANRSAYSVDWKVFANLPDGVVYRGTLGDTPLAEKAQWFSTLRGQGYAFAVTADIGIPDKSRVHYLYLFPSGARRAGLFAAKPAVPIDRATEMLFLPAPQQQTRSVEGTTVNVNVGPQYPQAPGWPGNPNLPTVGKVAFEEIQDPELRTKLRAAATSQTIGLADLEELATAMDAAGYVATAGALRDRKTALLTIRQVDASTRGGFLYIVRTGDLAGTVASYYSGKSAKRSLLDLERVNGGRGWKQFWVVGEEILLPKEWGDPSLRPLPPLARGGGRVPPSRDPRDQPGFYDPSHPGGPMPGYKADPPRPAYPGQPKTPNEYFPSENLSQEQQQLGPIGGEQGPQIEAGPLGGLQ